MTEATESHAPVNGQIVRYAHDEGRAPLAAIVSDVSTENGKITLHVFQPWAPTPALVFAHINPNTLLDGAVTEPGMKGTWQ